jgi:hypothetical protein
MNAVRQVSWLERNQEFLTTEFEHLKGRLRASDAAGRVRQAWDAFAAPPAIEWLAQLFALTPFERDVLILCAGVEMDSEIANLCGQARGYSHPACATFGLALGALPEPHWSALTPERPLRRFHLIEIEPGHGLTSAALRIDERVLHYLAGTNTLDPRLKPLVRPGPVPGCITPAHAGVASEAARVFDGCRNPAPLVHLCGDDHQGQEDVAGAAMEAAGRQVFLVRAADLPTASELDQFAMRWQREALLLNAALLIQCAPDGVNPPARQLAEHLPGIVFLASREPVRLNRAFLRFDVDKPKPADQKRIWDVALGSAAQTANGVADELAGQFRLSTRTILATGALVSTDGGLVKASELWNVCRAFSRPRLEDLAQRLVPLAGWDDLVLPELQMSTLRQLASQVRHRLQVYEDWGFSAKGCRGLGVSALFAGESGVGKTLAAEVLARDLALDLYRVDLAAVVSKYIGETSKNLRQVFDAAEEGGVLLLFDEADALFGKRGEVKDSHDRYANIDVAYLLQRMEAYQGLAILTTNMKTAVDRAFQRRLRFTVNFPFPDATQREAIWSRVFPRQTPTQNLDYRKLAQLNVAGGNIRNIALNAAFLAADARTAVTMAHVLRAARLEGQKLDRALSEAEIRGWV